MEECKAASIDDSSNFFVKIRPIVYRYFSDRKRAIYFKLRIILSIDERVGTYSSKWYKRVY